MTDITIALAPDGAHFLLTVPGAHSESTHTLTIPINYSGMLTMRCIFTERQHTTKSPKLGLTGNPVQSMVDQWLRDNTPTRLRGTGTQHTHVAIDLEALGL